ncbi:MAG TPA: hypothetical protein VNT57_04970 [Desulfobacteria bacterium]|nr:hypothetical protein [Desulfobacteria bacterium]
MKHRLFTLAVVLVFALFSAVGCAGNTEKKPIAEKNKTAETAKYATLMDEAGADPYKNGCVSCHKKSGDIDRSLPAYVKKIEGHPEVRESTVNACYFCHEAQKNPELFKKFVRGIHRIHWKSETFYGKQNARCYSCHTMESNGVSGLKEYPLAGYRTAAGAKSGSVVQKKAKTETKATEEAKKQPEAKQGGTQKPEGNTTSPSENKPNEGLAVPQNSSSDAELPIPTP